jgi:hypothetical protein
MNQSQLAKWLKFITSIVAVLATVFFFYMVPAIGRDFRSTYPEFAYLFWPYLIWIWVAAIPCYLALINLWRICREIARDNSFSRPVSMALRSISRLALFDTLLCFVVSNVYLFSNMLHPGLLIACFFVEVGGLAISLVAAVVSHWVEKGYALNEENALTI